MSIRFENTIIAAAIEAPNILLFPKFAAKIIRPIINPADTFNKNVIKHAIIGEKYITASSCNTTPASAGL